MTTQWRWHIKHTEVQILLNGGTGPNWTSFFSQNKILHLIPDATTRRYKWVLIFIRNLSLYLIECSPAFEDSVWKLAQWHIKDFLSGAPHIWTALPAAWTPNFTSEPPWPPSQDGESGWSPAADKRTDTKDQSETDGHRRKQGRLFKPANESLIVQSMVKNALLEIKGDEQATPG